VKTVIQSIVLRGDQHWGPKPPAAAVGEVMRLIPTAVQFSIRMTFEGRSTIRGARPAWLEAASDVRFVDLKGTSDTTLFFEAPQLGEAAPDLYTQREFWPSRPDPTDTGFDLLGDVVEDVSHANADSERFDNPLLRKLRMFDHALNGTFQSIDIVAGRYSVTAPATITRQVIETAKELTTTTPPSQAVRVYGRLDMIRASTQSFALKLLNGDEIRAVADGFDIGSLAEFFQKNVLVLGKAVYRPSGRPLRIDATGVMIAGDDQRFFSKVPPPRVKPRKYTTLQPSPGKGGVAAIFGRWPGEESDAEIEAALAELS
jgi:hypothetical protein